MTANLDLKTNSTQNRKKERNIYNGHTHHEVLNGLTYVYLLEKAKGDMPLSKEKNCSSDFYELYFHNQNIRKISNIRIAPVIHKSDATMMELIIM